MRPATAVSMNVERGGRDGRAPAGVHRLCALRGTPALRHLSDIDGDEQSDTGSTIDQSANS